MSNPINGKLKELGRIWKGPLPITQRFPKSGKVLRNPLAQRTQAKNHLRP